ncbi:MAG: ureidoglycolate lyase [Pirellulales bacterium]|jgi:ureidoglycolate lyase|nr:ureidoglycolate lyase [Pirellulales bacterium]
MSLKIKAQPITEEAFKPYGKLVRIKPDQEPLADNEDLVYWEKMVEFEPEIPRTIGLLTEKRREMVLTKMERHTKALEWFVPIDGRCVACFAEYHDPNDPDEIPDPEKVVAFEMDNIVGFVVNRGAWHWPAFPITETATQLVNLRRDTEHDDVDVKELSAHVDIVT